ncbi:retinol-binding protein pinta-like isoform X2 [Pogonomyrmex barbatus]|uniref:Retinol-binding protein pinta-like isoform X2 n=1 Tax=Pogonomyrmex barbatus TaxID=144034 RepID=A0A6I9X1X5_9HYME|nr:retinol-binding protein pinta-like isoform X2 [Pogonomyrmex barbatus]
MASAHDDSIVRAEQVLTSEDERYAAVHLNETNETKESAVVEIRRWIEESDNLRVRTDDFFILRFLRTCKFNVEKTKMRMQNYYKQRSDLPEWFMNKDPFQSELQELLNMGLFLPLRKRDNQGRVVIIIRGTRHDPRIHKISDICKIGVLATEMATKNYNAISVYGIALFIDVANPTMRHAVQMRPHIFRSFMNEKMKSRLNVYTQKTMQDCFKDIPVNILPVEYGGTDGTLQELTEYWKNLIEENRDWLISDENDQLIVSKQ